MCCVYLVDAGCAEQRFDLSQVPRMRRRARTAGSWHRPDAGAKMRPVVERCSLGGFTAALAAAVAVCAATAPYADAVHAAGRCRPRPHRPVFGLNVEALADAGKARLDVDLAPLVGGCRSPALFDAVRVSTISASRPLVWRFHHVRAHGGHVTFVLGGLTRGARLRVLVLLPRSRLTFGKS